jgi:hypothetical protein
MSARKSKAPRWPERLGNAALLAALALLADLETAARSA